LFLKRPALVSALYNALFGAEKEDIGPENTYPWNVKPQESTICLGPVTGTSRKVIVS
jgi:hypothetical protein